MTLTSRNPRLRRLASTRPSLEILEERTTPSGDFIPVNFSQFFNTRFHNLQPASRGLPEGDVTLGGVPFRIPVGGLNAWWGEAASGTYPRSIDVPIGRYSVDKIHSLINTSYGQPGPGSYVAVEFHGSNGAFYRKQMIGNVDVRDHYQASWTNSINGTSTVNVALSYDSQGNQSRLDKQEITLPDDFDDENLSFIRFIDSGGTLISGLILQGLTVAIDNNYVVTNTNDSGPGSLRQAILNANGNGATVQDTILFNIPTTDPGYAGGVFTIRPVSELPSLRAIILDGATQTAFTGDTNPFGPEVVINGSLQATGHGLRLDRDNVVANLVVNGFSRDPGGGYAIIGNNDVAGNNTILNNYIGTDPTGWTAVPNLVGVAVGAGSYDNRVEGNLISGNSGGIVVGDNHRGLYRNNRIGTNRVGLDPIPNGTGIWMGGSGATDNLFVENHIAFNLGDGILDAPDYRFGNNGHHGNAFRRNWMHQNGGLGINIRKPPLNSDQGNEVNLNDPGDTDTGGNGLQNFPVVTGAIASSSTTTVSGTLNSTANTRFEIEVFAASTLDATGYGEGETYLGMVAVTTDANGNATWTFSAPGNYAGKYICTTATDPSGNTSEFSQTLVAVPGVERFDDGEAGFATTGGWSTYAYDGYRGDETYKAAGDGSARATYTIAVTPGAYRVSATWTAQANRATNTPFRIYDGQTLIATVRVNQEITPSDRTDDGVTWKDLGVFTVTGTGLRVEVANDANEYVIADGLRLERVTTVAPQRLDDAEGGFATTGGGWNTYVGDGYRGDHTYHAAGDGSAKATYTAAVTPGTYRVSATWTAQGNRATNTPFRIYDGTTLLATVRVNQEQAPADFTDDGVGWKDLGNFTVSGSSLRVEIANDADEYVIADGLRLERVTAPPPAPPSYADDAEAGFAMTGGGWNTYVGDGYRGDHTYKAAGDGSAKATYTLAVTPGSYRISATWTAQANRATNTPFRIYDGATLIATVRVNQELAPSDRVDDGVGWQDLGVFTVSGTNLRVEIANDANEYVIADGLRVERVALSSASLSFAAWAGGPSIEEGSCVAVDAALPQPTTQARFAASGAVHDVTPTVDAGLDANAFLVSTFPDRTVVDAGLSVALPIEGGVDPRPVNTRPEGPPRFPSFRRPRTPILFAERP